MYSRPHLSRHAVAVFQLLLLGTASGAVPVEGERELLDALLDAQRTNMARLQRGECTTTVVHRERQGESFHTTTVQARVLWDEERTWWEYTLRHSSPEIREREEINPPPVVFAISDGKDFMQYYSKAKSLYIAKGQPANYIPQLRLRPEQIWFTYRQMDSTPWHRFLDPDRAGGTITKYVVRGDGPNVVVERHTASGPSFAVTASLAQGGNVLSYESLPNDEKRGFWKSGHYEWERHSSGVYWLRKLHAKRSRTLDPKDLDSELLVEISDFNPEPQIAANRFTLASLDLPKGTIVTERNGAREREYVIGGPALAVGSLDAFVDEVRRSGFAAPGR